MLSFRERSGSGDDRAKFYFELFDEDGSDEISKTEFKNIVFHLLAETKGEAMLEEELVGCILLYTRSRFIL